MENSTIVKTSRGLSIGGTRLTLYTIMDHLQAGWPPQLIGDWFNLTAQQVADILEYIETHRAEVEAEYRQVLQDAAETERYWRERNREHFERLATRPPQPGQEAVRAKLRAHQAQWERA
jgi:uncharacterized protein (DUF433 family)